MQCHPFMGMTITLVPSFLNPPLDPCRQRSTRPSLNVLHLLARAAGSFHVCTESDENAWINVFEAFILIWVNSCAVYDLWEIISYFLEPPLNDSHFTACHWNVCKRMSKGFDHNAERARRLRFYKNIVARPRALVVSAVSQNDHILLATTQLCCETLHLDTFCFFACFSWISFFEAELEKGITLITVQGVSKQRVIVSV